MKYQAVETAPRVNRASGAAVGLILASIIFAVLTVVIKVALPVPDIDADQAAIRTKDLQEIHATEENALANAGWVDSSRGIVRIPIESAIRLAAQKWQNPAAARTELNTRAENAAAPAPPAAPKPSAFE